MITSCLIIININGVNFYSYNFFQTAKKRSTQPAIKQRPPTGVIAPIHLIPEIAKAYKLPENKTIPATMKMADHFNNSEGKEIVSTPISNNPSAW